MDNEEMDWSIGWTLFYVHLGLGVRRTSCRGLSVHSSPSRSVSLTVGFATTLWPSTSDSAGSVSYMNFYQGTADYGRQRQR